MTEAELIDVLSRATYKRAKATRNPHEYTLRETWKSSKVFEEAVEGILKYGKKEWFWRKPYIVFRYGIWRTWTMGDPVPKTILINRAKDELVIPPAQRIETQLPLFRGQ